MKLGGTEQEQCPGGLTACGGSAFIPPIIFMRLRIGLLDWGFRGAPIILSVYVHIYSLLRGLSIHEDPSCRADDLQFLTASHPRSRTAPGRSLQG